MEFFILDKQSGYIALISVVIISVLLMTVAFTLSFSGFLNRFTILDAEFKEVSNGLAEACVDSAILRLAQDFGYTISPSAGCASGQIISVGSEQCRICSVEVSDAQNIIKTQGIFKDSYTNLIIKVSTSTNDIQVQSWEECNRLDDAQCN